MLICILAKPFPSSTWVSTPSLSVSMALKKNSKSSSTLLRGWFMVAKPKMALNFIQFSLPVASKSTKRSKFAAVRGDVSGNPMILNTSSTSSISALPVFFGSQLPKPAQIWILSVSGRLSKRRLPRITAWICCLRPHVASPFRVQASSAKTARRSKPMSWIKRWKSFSSESLYSSVTTRMALSSFTCSMELSMVILRTMSGKTKESINSHANQDKP
mmetsp:Transcript_121457/g.378030  ORF Transcript_121457/g.378030 Transcript_121457/m.378030 type:complete len:216 (-) Transcript_121457:598-1245(-)